MSRRALIALLITGLATPGGAQIIRQPPTNLPPAKAEISPSLPPDPKLWWDEPLPRPPEAADPLGGGRRLSRGERLVPIDNGIAPSTYRLWGLMPLQSQIVRGEEMVLELWIRPARSVRQSVVRIVVRRDGKAFVQARAGLACCEPEIRRRIGFDAELPAGLAGAFQALRQHSLWNAPRNVHIAEGGGAIDVICLDGTAYDLTLVVPGRSRSVRRSCDNAEVGQAADILEPVLRAALGHDPRLDVIFPDAADFSAARSAYADLLRDGGTLKAAPDARPQPPGVEAASELQDFQR